MTGRIKKMSSRGFGFIETEEDIDFFFHYKDYDGDWKELLSKYVTGHVLQVSFNVDKNSGKGPKAQEIVIISALMPSV